MIRNTAHDPRVGVSDLSRKGVHVIPLAPPPCAQADEWEEDAVGDVRILVLLGDNPGASACPIPRMR
eukprot:10245669-Alexandrium_andersonii.AAC.1